jgi:membrane protease YdiL (CAAX protease family)
MDNKKFPEPVEALLLLLGIFLSLFIITEIVAGFLQSGVSQQAVSDKQIRFFYLFGSSLFFIVPYFYARFRRYDTVELFRLRKIPTSVSILSLAGGLSLSVLIDELDRIINMIVPPPEWMEEIMTPLLVETTTDWILAVSGVVLAAAFAEEGLFRGFIQVSLEKKGDVTKAVLLSAATWALIHIIPYWAIQIFIIGVIFGFLSWRTGSIFPSVIMHGGNNLLALLYVNLELQESSSWYLWGEHVSPVVLVIAAAIFYYSISQISFIYKSSPDDNAELE